ncbi:DUF559 domain-containing protein [Kytococcus sp. Marseille-QA3725]
MPSVPPEVLTLLDAHHGTLTAADLRSLGMRRDMRDRLLALGVITRVARAAFVDGRRLRDAGPEEAHALRTVAVARTWPTGTAVSHDSAVVLHGLPVLEVPTRIRGTRMVPGPHRVSSYASIHAGGSALPTEQLRGCAVVSAADAAFGVASLHGIDAAVVVLDAALHRRRVVVPLPGEEPTGCATEADLAAVVEKRRHHAGAARFRAAIELVDPSCESVGETRTRLLLRRLGYRVRSQVEIHDAVGRSLGRADFVVEGEPVVIEFDGEVKYTRYGQTAAGDKRRDVAMQQAGFEVVRLQWRHLGQAEAVRTMVEHARARARRVA